MSYMVVNVFIFGRDDNKALFESIFMTIIAMVVFPIIYCSYFYDRKRSRNDDSITFNAVFYRETSTKLVLWKGIKRHKPRKVIYRTDAKIYSNILCD